MSMMLSRKALVVSGASSLRRSEVARPRAVMARAEPRVTQGREYREADNSISMPGASSATGPDGAPLYADEAAKTMLKPKSNLSPEMKKKLRQEYTSWGGAENKSMSGNYFLYIMAFVAVLAVASHLIGAI